MDGAPTIRYRVVLTRPPFDKAGAQCTPCPQAWQLPRADRHHQLAGPSARKDPLDAHGRWTTPKPRYLPVTGADTSRPSGTTTGYPPE